MTALSESITDKRKRFSYIDILKGLGIILMVMGHMHYIPSFEKLVFGFHMPLFFIISGYLYHRPEKMGAYVKRKAGALLVPYFVFGLAFCVLRAVRAESFQDDFMAAVRALFFRVTYDLPVESALWFLPVLFEVTVLYALLDRFIKKEMWKNIIICVLTLIGCGWGELFDFWLPWGLHAAMASIGFYLAGIWFRKKESFFTTAISGSRILRPFLARAGVCLIVAAVSAILIFLNERLDIREGQWGIIPLTYLNGLVYTGVCFCFTRMIDSRSGFLGKVLRFIGENSVVYVCLNHSAIYIGEIVAEMTRMKNQGYLAPHIIIVFLIAMTIMAVSAMILSAAKSWLLQKRSYV